MKRRRPKKAIRIWERLAEENLPLFTTLLAWTTGLGLKERHISKIWADEKSKASFLQVVFRSEYADVDGLLVFFSEHQVKVSVVQAKVHSDESKDERYLWFIYGPFAFLNHNYEYNVYPEHFDEALRDAVEAALLNWEDLTNKPPDEEMTEY